MEKIELFVSKQHKNNIIQEGYKSDSQNQGSSVSSRKSNTRILYFKKQYKLLIHKVHVFSSLSFLSINKDFAKHTKANTQAIYNLGEIVDIPVMNAIKGTQDLVDQNVILYLKQTNSTNNSIIGTIKFDMTQQKILKADSPKSFQKHFQDGSGFIQYKFISYKSQHIQAHQLTQQKQIKRQVQSYLKKTKQNQFKQLIAEKDSIIKQMESKIMELIGESKRIRKSVSKEKQKLLQDIAVLRTSPKRLNQRNQSNLGDYFKKPTKLNGKNMLRVPSLDKFDNYQYPEEENDQNVLEEKTSSFNINVKVLSSKARQKQIDTLRQIAKNNQHLKIENQALKQQIGTLNVQNKLLQEKISQLKTRHQKVVENKYNQLMENDTVKQISMKQSVYIGGQKPKKTRVSGFFGSDQFLSVGKDQNSQKRQAQAFLPKSFLEKIIQGKNFDAQTINLLQKIQHQKQMLQSKLAIKQEQCEKVMKQLTNCTIQLKKKSQQLHQVKNKLDEYKSKYKMGYRLDNSQVTQKESIYERPGGQSMKLSQKLSMRLAQVQNDGQRKPIKYQKLLQQMKQSIINYQQKIQDRQLQLMRSRLAQQTLHKQKSLYQNKYMNILQTLEDNKQKYLDALSKSNQIQGIKTNNQELRNISNEIMKKYQQEHIYRMQYQGKTQKYKQKIQEMFQQYQRLKSIQTQYDTFRRRTLLAEKNMIKFQTTYNQMKKFVLKIESAYYNVTKKSKKVREQVSEQEVQQQLSQSINRLLQIEQEYYDDMREFYYYQKQGIDQIFNNKIKLQIDKVQLMKQIKQQDKLGRKQAIQEALQSQRKSKRKKVDTKIKALIQAKNKNQEDFEKQGVNLHDRVKLIQKRIRQFQLKMTDTPHYKIRISSSQNLQNKKYPKSNDRSKKENQQQVTKQINDLKQKIEKLQAQNQKFKEAGTTGKESLIGVRKSFIVIDGKSSGDQYSLKNSGNLNLQMQKSTLGESIRANFVANESIIKQQRKSIMQEMNKNRQIFTKSFDEIKKQNSQLMRKKSDLQIQVQNYRFRQQKIIMKHQQRQRDLERMFKASNDELMNTKQKMQVKIQKLQKQFSITSRQNKQLTESLSIVVLQLRKLSGNLQDKQKHLIQLIDQNTLIKDRIFAYQSAQQKMIVQVEDMKMQVIQSEQNFTKLFQQRNQQFVKIQKSKSNEIQKYKKLVKSLQNRIEEELAQQCRIKTQLEHYQEQLKRIEQVNLGLEESQKLLSQKLQNIRKNSTQELVRVDEQNQQLRTQLMKLAQETGNLQEQLQKCRCTIQSLQKQVQVLQPVYNQMCQMQLKHQTEKQNYQDILANQNQKYSQLKQRHQKIIDQIKQVENQNKSLRSRDLQFEEFKLTLNDKIFEKERLCLQIEKEKYDVQIQNKRLINQVKQMSDKVNNYVMENHELAVKIQEMQLVINSPPKMHSGGKSRFRGESSYAQDPNNQSRVFGRPSRMLGDSFHGQSPGTKNDISASRLRLSRSNSKVLNRSKNKIQTSRNIKSSNQIGITRSVQRSNTLLSRIGRSSNLSRISINPIMHQKDKYNQQPSPRSPYIRMLKDDLHKIQQNIDQMKATIMIKSKNQNDRQGIQSMNRLDSKAGENLSHSKNLQQDLNIEEVQDSQIKEESVISQNKQGDQMDFVPQDQSEYQILIQLDKIQIIQRVHELKQQLQTLIDQNQGLIQQVKNYQRIVKSSLNQSQAQEQDQQNFPRIEVYKQNQSIRKTKSRNLIVDEQSSINNNMDYEHSRTKNMSFIQRQKNNSNMAKVSRRGTLEKDYEDEITKLKQQISQKQLILQEQKQEISSLEQQLQHEKQNTQKLLNQVSFLISDTQKIQKTLRQKNRSIQSLNLLLIQQKQSFDQRLEKILAQNLQKDQIVRQIAQRCDKLQRIKEQSVRQKIKIQQKSKKYIKQYQKLKRRQKANQKSYKQYEQQSQLQILKLKQQIDRLVQQLVNKKSQIYQLAERYIQLETICQNHRLELLQKGNQHMGEKQKIKEIIQKYKQLSQKYQNSQKALRLIKKQRQTLQHQIRNNQQLIADINKKNSMCQKKFNITFTTQQQQCNQLKSKNQQLQSHIINLKHQISHLNEQLLSFKRLNDILQLQNIKIEKQLKQIMLSYQQQFHSVQDSKHNIVDQLNQHHKLTRQKDKQLQSLRRDKRSQQSQLYKTRNQLFQLQKQLQTYKRKTQQQYKQMNEKYQFKNHQFQMLRKKVDKEIDTTTQTITKQTNKQKKLEDKLVSLQKTLKQKDSKLSITQQKLKQKQQQLTKKQQTHEQQQKILSFRVKQLQTQIKYLNQQLTFNKQVTYNNQASYNNNHQSVIQSLNSQLYQYSTRLEQLQRQNFYLKRENQQYLVTVEEIKLLYRNKQNKMKEKIFQLEEQVEFYKAKRIDELNMLLNQTDD